MTDESFNPLVSIIIPVYNGADYMREAIDSAIAQTYENTEIIVVNDGSRDNGETERIAKEYGDRIKYIFKENGGVSTALNTGIKNMSGEYFSWLSHDDVYTPDKIEKQVSALSEMKDDVSVVCCANIHIDKNSEPIGAAPEVKSGDKKLIPWEDMLLSLFENGPVHGCALLIKKTVFDDVGLFDETLRFYQDGFMWYKIFMAKYDVLMISDVCVKGRIHSKQLTQTGQSMFRGDCEKMSEIMIPQLLQVSTTEKNFLSAYIKYNAKYGNAGVVKRACKVARKAKILTVKNYFSIYLLYIYGFIRPVIRKIYYAVFRRIKTS